MITFLSLFNLKTCPQTMQNKKGIIRLGENPLRFFFGGGWKFSALDQLRVSELANIHSSTPHLQLHRVLGAREHGWQTFNSPGGYNRHPKLGTTLPLKQKIRPHSSTPEPPLLPSPSSPTPLAVSQRQFLISLARTADAILPRMEMHAGFRFWLSLALHLC